MSALTSSPRLLKSGIVLVNPATSLVERIITLQYNPESVTRTLQAQGVADSSGDRSEALRLRAPAVETIKIEAEIDATDDLELPAQHAAAAQYGIQPQLAALEGMVNPRAEQLLARRVLADAGTIEIAPTESPLTLFVWSRSRIVPVRVTEFSVTEDAFDAALNPIRARVSLGMRVLTTDDLGFASKGGNLFLTFLKTKEEIARQTGPASLGNFGIGALP
jgi:hypothetical protein